MVALGERADDPCRRRRRRPPPRGRGSRERAHSGSLPPRACTRPCGRHAGRCLISGTRTSPSRGPSRSRRFPRRRAASPLRGLHFSANLHETKRTLADLRRAAPGDMHHPAYQRVAAYAPGADRKHDEPLVRPDDICAPSPGGSRLGHRHLLRDALAAVGLLPDLLPASLRRPSSVLDEQGLGEVLLRLHVHHAGVELPLAARLRGRSTADAPRRGAATRRRTRTRRSTTRTWSR